MRNEEAEPNIPEIFRSKYLVLTETSLNDLKQFDTHIFPYHTVMVAGELGDFMCLFFETEGCYLATGSG